jgi:cytochrome c-type biogenesis protein
MREIALEYYRLMSSISVLFSTPIRNLADAINLPAISVLLFGILGATAPCQLSTSIAAFAFLSRNVDNPRNLKFQTLAYVLGRVTVYVIVGGVLVALGLQLNQINQTAIPIVVAARKVFGPLLIIVGLFMFGSLSLRFSIGDKMSAWLYAKVGKRKGLIPSYLLGIAFSFTFCPTLFWLFFGLTIPLAIASPGGIVFPAIFAAGTVLPLLTVAFLSLYVLSNRQLIQRASRASVWIKRIAGIVFILVGINEMILYWLI